MSYNQRALLVGPTQWGKSAFAQYLAARMTGTRRLVVNVKGRLRVGVPPVRDVKAIDWRAPVIDFIPRTLERDVFEELYAAAWAVGGPMVVWTDEAMSVTTGNYAPTYLQVLQTQGEEVGVGHLACTQRPQRIALSLRSEADHVWIFGRTLALRDRQVIADEMGLTPDELAERMAEVIDREGKYSSLWWHRGSGELVDCGPLPAGWVGAPLLVAPRHREAARRQPSSAPELEPGGSGAQPV